MLDGWSILKVVGKALVVRGGKFLLNAVSGGVLGEAVDVAQYAWEEWRKAEASEEARQGSLQALAQAPIQEVRRHAAQVAQEVAADQPEAVRQNLVNYLTHVPATVRRSLRRASDPSGTTIPAGLVLRKADDLLALLPSRLPRFKEGDFPLANVDLELVELLGVGGFGEVWKARNPYQQNDPPVAWKFCIDADAASSLRNEAALLNRVKSQGTHPGIVRLLDTHLRADPPCLKYEYIPGGDLGGLIQEWHRTAGGVRPDKAAKVVLRLAEIVGFAHGLNRPIVHRDLKPANVLVQKKDKGIVLKVADFGIGGVAVGQAVAESRGDSTKALLAATVARGSYSLLYASPQQMAGLTADPRDDVYALGVIWFQLLTGDLAKGVGVDYAEDLREAGVDGRMIALLGRCVAAKSERRPATAADLAAALKELLGESPATVDPPAARQPPAPQPSESKTPAATPDVDSPPRTPPAPADDRILEVLRQAKARFPKLFEEAPFAFLVLKVTMYLHPSIPDKWLTEAKKIYAVPEDEVVLGLLNTLTGHPGSPVLFGRNAVYCRSLVSAKSGNEPQMLSYEEFVRRPFGCYGFAEASSEKPNPGDVTRGTVYADVIELIHFVQEQMLTAAGTTVARSQAGPATIPESPETPASETKQLRGNTDVVRPAQRVERPPASQKQPTQVREILKLEGPEATTNGFRCAVFSPDGTMIWSDGPGYILAWDAANGRIIRHLRPERATAAWTTLPVNSLACSPDGRCVLSGGNDGYVRLWDAATGAMMRELSGGWSNKKMQINAVAFSPDGRLALIGGDEPYMELWDVANDKQARKFKAGNWAWRNIPAYRGAGKYVGTLSVAFAADCSRVLSAHTLTSHGMFGPKCDFASWDADSGQEANRFCGHKGDVNCVAVSSDNRYVLSGSSDHTARLWELSNGKEVRTFNGHAAPVHVVAFSPDCHLAASAGPCPKDDSSGEQSAEAVVRVWRVESGEEVCELKGHTGFVTGVSFSPDGRSVLSAGIDKTIRIWPVSSL